MKSILSKSIVLLLLITITFTSCSSVTRINSVPQGAKVYVNEEYKGITPFDYSDTKIIYSTSRVKLVKEGYRDFSTTITRDEELQPCACLGGFILILPFLWVMGYNSERTYEMERKK